MALRRSSSVFGKGPGCEAWNPPETTMTDERMALLELIEKGADADLVRELLAYRRRAADGGRGRAAHRRRRRSAHPGPDQPPERLPRARLGDPRRPDRAGHPEAAQGLVLPGLPGAAPDRREGPDGGHPGGLRPRRLDPLGRRPGQGDGRHRHLEEPGLAPVRGHRRARPGLPHRGRSRAAGPTSGSTPPT